MNKVVRSMLTEYGVKWTVNRALYSAKIKMMSLMPATEKLFEKKVQVKRIDIFDFNLSLIKSFLLRLSDVQKKEIISTADKATIGVLKAFSSVELNYGNPINWHFNPITGGLSPKNTKWYKIPDFDEELGDIKVIWEASRFTHFFSFIRAYLITNDIKYYRAFSLQLSEWLKNNPYSYGANFKCGQENTLRMINALMVYEMFKNCGVTTENDEENVTKLVEVSYRKVLSNFFYAHKCIKNNHTFTEICGLIIGSWCCEDLVGLKKAYKLLDKEIVSQFQPDGGFTQYSFNYHRFTLQIIECIYKISEKTHLTITESDRIKNSVLLLYQLQNYDGDVPNYGSNDGALIFPLTSCGYRDFRPVLNTVYALIEGKRLYEAGDYDEELLWFASKKDFPVENIRRKTSFFNKSGFYSFRHKNGFLMTCLQEFRSRPAHMDQLHIDLWHKGINIFCDTGTFSYASNLGKKLTSTIGHNTVKPSDVEQMDKKGAFFVFNWSDRRDVVYGPTSFKGTMVSRNNYEHTRIIEKLVHGYSITDKVIGDFESCDFYFNTPCHVKITSNGFELYNEDRCLCKVYTIGQIEVTTAHRSLYYMKSEEINCVMIKGTMKEKQCNMYFDIELSD